MIIKYLHRLLFKFRLEAWRFAAELEYILYPWKEDPLQHNKEDYYIKVKDDQTGESYFIIDWIKSHKELIESLQDDMIYVKSEISKLNQNEKNYN